MSTLASIKDEDLSSPMETDLIPSTSLDLAPYLIDEDGAGINTKQQVMQILDSLESHVERIRKEAAKLEEEKDNILSSLDTIRLLPAINDLTGLEHDEAFRYLDHIQERCQTVHVQVTTQRDQSQEEALHQVNHLIDNLVVYLKSDAEGARSRCITYMNSCSSSATGMTDKHFESALLGCTVDDQKKVKKRLQGLLRYFDKHGVVTEVH